MKRSVDHARFGARIVVFPGHFVNDAPVQQGDQCTMDSCSSADQLVVVTLLLEGDEDPVSMMKRGGVTLEWCGQRKVTRFKQQTMPHILDRALALPTLYLHMLDTLFSFGKRVGPPLTVWKWQLGNRSRAA